MATAQKTPAELEAEKKRLELQRDVLKLEAEVIAARNARSAAESPPAKTPAQEAADRKAEYDALAAQHNAQKAAADAEAAADKAAIATLIGTVPSSGLSGSVQVKSDAGKGEATLLSATAISKAAVPIGTAVAAKVGRGRNVLVYTGTDRPRFQHWRLFWLRQRLINQSIAVARGLTKEATDADQALGDVRPLEAGTTEAPPLAVAGAALEALKNLGSFFQSDYEIGGIALTADDSLLAAAVVGQLRSAGKDVIDPSRYVPATADTDVATLLAGLESQLSDASQMTTSSEARAKELREKAAAKETPAKDKPRFLEVAARYERAVAAWKAASEGYNTLLRELSTADASGTVLAFKVAEEKFLADRMAAGDMALFLKVNSAVGGYYTKKNLWTFFGGMPFYAMGGAVVSYSLIDGKTGIVQASGEVPVHSGYARANRVADMVGAAPAPGK